MSSGVDGFAGGVEAGAAENLALHVDPVGLVLLQLHGEPVGVEVVTIYLVGAVPFHEFRGEDVSPDRGPVHLDRSGGGGVGGQVVFLGRRAAARVRPRARALVVLGPHLHLVGDALHQPRQRRSSGRAGVALVTPAPAVARPVPHVVVGDRRTRVGRRRPVHPQTRRRRRRHPRLGRLARRLRVHVGHRHRDGLRRGHLPRPHAAGRLHHDHVVVVVVRILRVLEVGGRVEGQHPRRCPDGEETLVRTAGDRVAR